MGIHRILRRGRSTIGDALRWVNAVAESWPEDELGHVAMRMDHLQARIATLEEELRRLQDAAGSTGQQR